LWQDSLVYYYYHVLAVVLEDTVEVIGVLAAADSAVAALEAEVLAVAVAVLVAVGLQVVGNGDTIQ
jgi:hypothetical protein